MMRSAKRVVTLAGTIVLLAAMTAIASPAAAAPKNNGSAAIAGSQCERAFKGIVTAGVVQRTDQKEAFFSCSGGSIVIEVKDTTKNKTDQLVIGSTKTLQTRSINGLGRAERDRAASELGIGSSEAQARSTGATSNDCLPNPPAQVSTFVDDSTHAHGNTSICYGRFIKRGGVAVEIVWSDTLSYVMRQALTSRTVQTFSVANISTNQGYEIGIKFQWNQRKTETLQPDGYVGSPETLEMLPFEVGHLQSEEYFPSQSSSEGTYHLTNDYTTIEILEGPDTGGSILTHPNMRMPDFVCPGIGDGPCHF